MIFGLGARHALIRAQLPVNSIGFIEQAKQFLNDAIQEYWYMTPADWRQSRSSITTVANADEYTLNKLHDGFVPNSLRGPSTNPRTLTYKDPIEFFRITKNHSDSTGDPNIYTHGDLSGVDQQISSASQIDVLSSFASATSGTMKVTNGDDVIESSDGIFNLNHVGLRLEIEDDNRTYKIGEYLSATKARLNEKYRGTTASAANFKVGDVGVHVSVSGFVGGILDSEDVILDGSNAVRTTKTFTLVSGVAKSDLTGGKITARNTDKTINIANLSPGEMELERYTVVLWRIPSTAEVLKYRFYMKHPQLWLDTDRILLPNKFHRLLVDLTEADLREANDKQIGSRLAAKITEGKFQFDQDANDSSLWRTIPQDEEVGQLVDIGRRDIDQDFTGAF